MKCWYSWQLCEECDRKAKCEIPKLVQEIRDAVEVWKRGIHGSR